MHWVAYFCQKPDNVNTVFVIVVKETEAQTVL